jgi:dihydrofolate reductase
MPSIQYYCAATLDGYIADPDDGLDWLTGYRGSYDGRDAPPREGGYDDFYEGVGALVTGSVTYEWVLDHVDEWPYAGKPCWVLTSRDLPWPDGGEGVDVRFANGSIAELAEEMIAAAGERALWVIGGGNVASQFAEAGLLDEVMVTIVPVVLGGGKPLFDRGLPGGPMQLTDVLPRASGMVELRYQVRR